MTLKLLSRGRRNAHASGEEKKTRQRNGNGASPICHYLENLERSPVRRLHNFGRAERLSKRAHSAGLSGCVRVAPFSLPSPVLLSVLRERGANDRGVRAEPRGRRRLHTGRSRRGWTRWPVSKRGPSPEKSHPTFNRGSITFIRGPLRNVVTLFTLSLFFSRAALPARSEISKKWRRASGGRGRRCKSHVDLATLFTM